MRAAQALRPTPAALPAVAELLRALVYLALVTVAITLVLPALIDLAAAAAR